ncbi:TPA: hypothetical protein NEG48_000355 [Elizabethkingia anophelis]|nr:hypothetical protein [Elizabethkingia anophelis]
MKKNKIEINNTAKSSKREYIPPVIEVSIIEMEEGIASGSAKVAPNSTGGLVDDITTEWDGKEVIDTETPF